MKIVQNIHSLNVFMKDFSLSILFSSVVPLTHKCVQADLKTPGSKNLSWYKLTIRTVLHNNYANLYVEGLLHLLLKLELMIYFFLIFFFLRGKARKVKNNAFPRVLLSLGKVFNANPFGFSKARVREKRREGFQNFSSG